MTLLLRLRAATSFSFRYSLFLTAMTPYEGTVQHQVAHNGMVFAYILSHVFVCNSTTPRDNWSRSSLQKIMQRQEV